MLSFDWLQAVLIVDGGLIFLSIILIYFLSLATDSLMCSEGLLCRMNASSSVLTWCIPVTQTGSRCATTKLNQPFLNSCCSVTQPLTSTCTQMAVMVVDLLMSYGVVDSGSVMAWILTPQMHALYPSCDCAVI